MAEQTRDRVREREAAPGGKYEELLALRGAFNERNQNGKLLIRDSDREWEQGKQGYGKIFLMDELTPDTALRDWYVFVHDIKKQSGKHRHQGGLVLFVLEGEGSTEVNGEIIHWEEGDCILLPILPEGCEHVHFNRGNGTAKWIAFIYVPTFDAVASELVQTEVAQAFLDRYGGA
ncbi:MAG: cupin domain-containing protein [Pseudomonadota bacterium]|nr:cupin domain-containing protein [Pseudomonadota bacterium]